MEFTKLHLLVLAALASLGSCALGAGPMTKAPPPPAANLNHLNQTIDKVSADGNSTGSCASNCTFAIGQQDPVMYKWVEVSYTSTFTAVTLFYIVNTEASTTIKQWVTNTNIPPNVLSPRFDPNGIRFDEISTPGGGGPVKVTYPTPFIDWGSTYRWSGVLLTKASPGATDTCVTQTAEVTATLSSNPQPTADSPMPSGSDPKGLHFALIPMKDPTLRKKFASLFMPDHAAFNTCTIIPDAQQPLLTPAVAWETVTSTRTEGASGVPLPAHTGPPNLGSSMTGPAPHVPDETQSANPVQGGQVVQSSWPADQPPRPLSIIAASTAKAGASVIAGSIPSSATSKGSPKQGTAQEAAAVHSITNPSFLGLTGLVVLAVCKLCV